MFKYAAMIDKTNGQARHYVLITKTRERVYKDTEPKKYNRLAYKARQEFIGAVRTSLVLKGGSENEN